jgi:hypothetical protein
MNLSRPPLSRRQGKGTILHAISNVSIRSIETGYSDEAAGGNEIAHQSTFPNLSIITGGPASEAPNAPRRGSPTAQDREADSTGGGNPQPDTATAPAHLEGKKPKAEGTKAGVPKRGYLSIDLSSMQSSSSAAVTGAGEAGKKKDKGGSSPNNARRAATTTAPLAPVLETSTPDTLDQIGRATMATTRPDMTSTSRSSEDGGAISLRISTQGLDMDVLNDLRHGIRVLKYDKHGKPQRRILYLEDGPNRSSPRLAWKPENAAYGLLRRLMKKPQHLEVGELQHVRQGPGSPRLQKALSKSRLKAVGETDDGAPQYMTLCLVSPGRSVDLELVREPGMTGDEAMAYYERVVSSLETLMQASGGGAGTPSGY